jgi:hypothetical protein
MNWEFVGRASELATLDAGWRAAGDEAGSIMVVHGEPVKRQDTSSAPRCNRAIGFATWAPIARSTRR